MSRMPWLALLCLLLSCSGGPEAKLEQARAQLASGDWTAAATSASAGLAAGAEGSTAWRLELAALEAEARGGRGAETLARLERLGQGPFAAQTGASLYVQTAGQLREGGDAAGAIGVLDAGAKRFPSDTDIARAIGQAKASGSDAERERLRSLGYIQ
jgi:hypothetical protein